MLSKLLQHGDRFVPGDQVADAVVVPAFCIDLNGFTDTHQEFMQGAAEGNVVIPCRTGAKHIIIIEIVDIHDDIAGIAVIGLGYFKHQEHLRPGLQIEILLILFGIIVQNGVPSLREPVFDPIQVYSVFRCSIPDIINIDHIVFQRHVMHLGKFKLFFRGIGNMIVLYDKTIIVVLVVLFGTQKIIT